MQQAEPMLITRATLSLFPLSYGVHVVEEYFGGFPARASEVSGMEISNAAFLSANFFFLVLMCLAISWYLTDPSKTWLLVLLSSVLLINGTLHLVSSLFLTAYVGGVISGVFLWWPLSLWVLSKAYVVMPPLVFLFSVFFGIVAHLLVPLVLLVFSLLL